MPATYPREVLYQWDRLVKLSRRFEAWAEPESMTPSDEMAFIREEVFYAYEDTIQAWFEFFRDGSAPAHPFDVAHGC